MSGGKGRRLARWSSSAFRRSLCLFEGFDFSFPAAGLLWWRRESHFRLPVLPPGSTTRDWDVVCSQLLTGVVNLGSVQICSVSIPCWKDILLFVILHLPLCKDMDIGLSFHIHPVEKRWRNDPSYSGPSDLRGMGVHQKKKRFLIYGVQISIWRAE